MRDAVVSAPRRVDSPFAPGLIAHVDLGALDLHASTTVPRGVVYSTWDNRVLMHPDDLDRLRFLLEIRDVVRDGMRDVLKWLAAAGAPA